MRQSCGATIVAIVAVACMATGADAQHMTHEADPDLGAADFRNLVREGTIRFADRNTAIRAGYRAVGGDFPAMGRHWVHPGIILRRELTPDSPAILSYADIGGSSVLVGVAFAVPLNPGEKPPPVAGKARAWHEHNGSVSEESLVRGHSHRPSGATTRLAILHVWVGVENPDGLFATDNWALPFVRAGLAVPSSIMPGASRAISLVSGGADYYAMLIGTGRPTDPEVARLLDVARDRAQSVIGFGEPGRALTSPQLDGLANIWEELVEAVELVAGEAAIPLRVATARDD